MTKSFIPSRRNFLTATAAAVATTARAASFDDRPDVLLSLVGQFREGRHRHAIGGNVRAFHPAAVDELEQVVLRTDGAIEVTLPMNSNDIVLVKLRYQGQNPGLNDSHLSGNRY